MQPSVEGWGILTTEVKNLCVNKLIYLMKKSNGRLAGHRRD